MENETTIKKASEPVAENDAVKILQKQVAQLMAQLAKNESSGISESSVEAAKAMQLEGSATSTPVPPQYRKAVDDYLGKDFGCYVNYDVNDSGFMVSIVVPLPKSNASKEYLEANKADIRTRALTNGQGLAGVIDWCKRIRKNLEFSGIKFPVIN